MLESDIINDEEIELILNEVLFKYGYDFTEYSKTSIKRRLNRLCILDKYKNFTELKFAIFNKPNYLERFIEEITVNVTEMFRDPSFYKTLRNDVIPLLGTQPHIRIWLAGCSTGEEVYSLAILLHEFNLIHKSVIYATDINPTVLEKANRGVYNISQMKLYSENYINSGGIKDFSEYYTANYSHVKFSEFLKKSVIYSTHNLVSDGSFNEFQLIICRNVLIYFNKDLQERVFSLFDSSIENLGFLALGAKETIRYSNISKKYQQIKNERIWRKTSLINL
jgi:chemotaxis protein methyltransferase CheR